MKNMILAAIPILTVFTVDAAFPAEDDAAMSAFSEGTALFKSEQYKAAAGAFREAYSLRPSWKILFNIGQCHAAAKEYGLALEAFEAYLSDGGDEVPLDKKNEVLDELKTLRELIGYVEIQGSDGMSVYLDDDDRGLTPLPGPIPTAAGANHQVRIEQNGTVLLERTVRINSGNTITISASGTDAKSSVQDKDKPEVPVLKASAPKKSSKPLMVTGLVTGGIGIGTLAGAVATGVSALSINSDLKQKDCNDNTCDDDVKRMNNLQLSTNILLGVGGTLTAAGVTMLIVSLVKKKKTEKSASIFPEVSPSAAGITVSGRF